MTNFQINKKISKSQSILAKEVEAVTETDSDSPNDTPSQIDIFNSYIPNLKQALVGQHDIAAKVADNIFSADKLVRLLSNTIKVLKSYNLVSNLKEVDLFAVQLGQLRRLLRIDRTLMIVKDYYHYYKKKRLTKFEMFLFAFKMMIFVEDITDMECFLMQFRRNKGQYRMAQMRRRIANLYFFECMGWLINYIYEYWRAESAQLKQKNLIVIMRYIIDTLISHNDFSKRSFTLDTKITSFLGLFSSVLNIYLIWK